MNNLQYLRANVNFSQKASSNLLQSVLLLITAKKVPSCFMDFVVGLSLIDQNSHFSKEKLKKVFKRFFPRLFNNTTFDGKVIQPFEHFFTLTQANYFSNEGLLKKVDTNLFRINHIQSNISTEMPHKHLYQLRINNQLIEQYAGNMTNLVKDCAWLTLEELCKRFSGVIFTHKLIQMIFGLTKNDVKNYLKKTHSSKEYVFRHIGQHEQNDLELDENILGFHKKYKFIRGFKINIGSSLEHDFTVSFSHSALSSIKDRLEKGQHRYNVANFFAFVTNSNRPQLNGNECQFNDQYERLGHKCVSNAHSRYVLKRYVENVNLGSFKQMKNIYSYLNNNYSAEKVNYKSSFRESYNKLLKKFIYQF
jgi:hypothetical protein